MSIYDKGWLMRFLNPKNQPKKLKDYLKKEGQLLLKHVLKGSSLIDFGCGYGRHLELLNNRLTYGLGLDIVDEYIKLGQKRLKKYSNLELRLVDIKNTTFANQFNYAICMNNTLGNIKEKNLVISKMKNAILTEGKVIAGIYSGGSIDTRIKWYKNTGLDIQKVTDDYILTANGFKSWHFSKEQLNKLFGICSIEDIGEIGYFVTSKKIV